MATNKNQHYVPRCHLKPFTLDGANRSIALYNLDRRALIESAPVKNQCSRDYFYGVDEILESAIQHVEEIYATTTARLRDCPKELTADDKFALRRFWLLQHMRTEAAAIKASQMSQELVKFAGDEAKDLKIELKEAVQIAMGIYAQNSGFIDDLSACIVLNRTPIPFCTSDDPAIITNRWYIHRKVHEVRSFGLGSSGALGILPLTPRMLCILYDRDVYSLEHENGFLSCRTELDIHALNEHQVLNCAANIYLHDPLQLEKIEQELSLSIERRIYPRHVTRYAVKDRVEGNFTKYRVVDSLQEEEHNEAIIHSKVVHLSPRRWPGFLKWRANGSYWQTEMGGVTMRRAQAEARYGTTRKKISL